MSRSKSTVVSTATIRAAFAKGGTLNPAKVTIDGKPVSTASLFGADGSGTKVRGRIHPAFVAAFLDANPGTVFGEGENAPASRTVDLPLVSAKTGRPIKPVTVPVSEAKALAGVKGKRGRLSSDELSRAAAAYQSA
jgi:hypothetical protein